MVATKDGVAQLIVGEAKARNHTREECLGELSALYQESEFDETIWDPTHTTFGVAQQDGSYAHRFDGAAAQVKAFFDKLDVKRTSPGHGDIWLNICWLQQAPNWPSAQYWWDHGRQAYLTEIKSRIGTVTPYLDKYWPTGQPAPAPQGYGLPAGSNSGGYGGNGIKFPDWVYQLGNAFNVKPSTYPGHQESDRNEAGYAPNPQHLNRGIDWAGSVADMQRLADYLFSIKGELEQVIWWNPDGRKIGVAGGKDVTNTPYYNYPGGYDDHRDHVHTRQSHPIPVPGGPITVPPPVIALRPQFEEREMFGHGGSTRSRQPINFFIHTEEGNGTAESLAKFCDGSNNVSYHYTLRDRIVYDVVDTDLYSWSVLNANVFSINLCFAGSFAGWSREQWMQREGDIEIAAYLAVQDCHKYAMTTEVLPPRPGQQGSEVYAGNPRSGISDHNYVTRELGIGNHTDVGNNFPWDVFTSYVNKYANAPTQGDDDLSADAERMIREMYDEYKKEKRGPSRSFLATDGALVESPLGFLYNMDGNVWTQQLTWAYLFHVPLALEVVESVAKNGSYQGTWVASNDFNAWLNQFGQAYCQGLVEFKAALVSKLSLSAQKSGATTSGPTQTVSASAIAAEVASLLPAPDTSALNAAYADNARLREENARMQAQSALPAVVYRDEPSEVEKTSGDIAGSVLDSVKEWTARLLTMDAEERGALSTSLKALHPPTGSQS